MSEEKAKCPDCGVELVLTENKPPAKCAKCGLNLPAYSGLARLLAVYEKNREKKPTSKEEGESDGFLDSLTKL